MKKDLRITVRGNGDDHAKTKEHHCHAAPLAAQTAFIDTMLATPMKENQEHITRLANLEPSIWEAMLEFLSPTGSRDVTVRDAKQLAVHCDKCDFPQGGQL